MLHEEWTGGRPRCCYLAASHSPPSTQTHRPRYSACSNMPHSDDEWTGITVFNTAIHSPPSTQTHRPRYSACSNTPHSDDEWTGITVFNTASHSPPSTQTHRPRYSSGVATLRTAIHLLLTYSACSNAPHSDDEWTVSLCLIQPHTRRLAHRHTDHATLPLATCHIQTKSGLVSLYLIQGRYLAATHSTPSTQTHVGGGNVIWRVAGNITLCDPIWHASSRNGEASC